MQPVIDAASSRTERLQVAIRESLEKFERLAYCARAPRYTDDIEKDQANR